MFKKLIIPPIFSFFHSGFALLRDLNLKKNVFTPLTVGMCNGGILGGERREGSLFIMMRVLDVVLVQLLC